MTITNTDDQMMTVKSVAKFFDVTLYTVRQWIRDGQLQAFKVNGAWRIWRTEVIRYANAQYGEK